MADVPRLQKPIDLRLKKEVRRRTSQETEALATLTVELELVAKIAKVVLLTEVVPEAVVNLVVARDHNKMVIVLLSSKEVELVTALEVVVVLVVVVPGVAPALVANSVVTARTSHLSKTEPDRLIDIGLRTPEMFRSM